MGCCELEAESDSKVAAGDAQAIVIIVTSNATTKTICIKIYFYLSIRGWWVSAGLVSNARVWDGKKGAYRIYAPFPLVGDTRPPRSAQGS